MLGGGRRVCPRTERKVDFGNRGIAHGLVPPVDGLCECVGEERTSTVAASLSRREQCPRAGNLEHAHGERVVCAWGSRRASASDQ